MSAEERIGIAGCHVEIANLHISSDEVSRITDIAQHVVEKKLGIKEVHRWGPDPGPDAAALGAARRALGGLHPAQLDLIVTLANPYHTEMESHGYATVLRDKLGADNAEVLEISDTCASTMLALQAVKERMLAEPDVRHALIVGVMMTLDSVDLTNPRTTFLANISDGAGAMLVTRDPQGRLDNAVMGSAQVCDPGFIDDMPITSPYRDEVSTYRKRYRSFLPRRVDIADKDGFKTRLDPVTFPAYVGAIHGALENSGFGDHELDLIAPNTMKPSLWNSILDHFKLEGRNQLYLEDIGHMAFLDQFLYLQRIREQGKLAQGGTVVLVSAGMGFHWAATCVAFRGPRTDGRLP